MSKLRKEYEIYANRREEWLKNPMVTKYFIDQEKRYVHPFQIYGNVWYVGDSWVCVHLIDTGDGLLLIDAGNVGATAMLVNAIWEAGFKPSDVKWIVLSHGHLDHVGGCMFFRKMFGTKLYMGKPDAEDFKNNPEFSVIHDAGNLAEATFEVDHEIEDGEKIKFGNTEMEFFSVPGHSNGVISCFFNVDGPEGVKRAGYFGGFGFNTLQKDYLIDIGDTKYEMRNIYLDSLKKVRDQKVELFLANHCINNDTLGRMKKMKSNPKVNPFLNDKLWGEYLDFKRDELIKLMSDPNQV